MNKKFRTFWTRFWQDKRGHLVIWQFPNVPLIGWAVCVLIAFLLAAGHLKTGIDYLGNLLLFTWAYLEITQGLSYFRRFLGAVVVVKIILSLSFINT